MVSAIVIYICAGIAHIILHRLCLKKGRVPVDVFGVYGLGGALLILLHVVPIHVVMSIERPFGFLPLTSVFVYISLSYLTILLTGNSYLSNENPATIMLQSFRTQRVQSRARLYKRFTKQGLIIGRLRDLKRTGFIQQQGAYFSLTPKGACIVRCMSVYEWIFGWKVGG